MVDHGAHLGGRVSRRRPDGMHAAKADRWMVERDRDKLALAHRVSHDEARFVDEPEARNGRQHEGVAAAGGQVSRYLDGDLAIVTEGPESGAGNGGERVTQAVVVR